MSGKRLRKNSRAYLVEIDARTWSTLDGNGDPVAGTEVTLRASDVGFNSQAKVNTTGTYPPTLREPLSITRKAFDFTERGLELGGDPVVEMDAVILSNEDGRYDSWPDTYTFDGAEIRVKRVKTARAANGAWVWDRANIDTIHTGIVDGQPEVSEDRVRILSRPRGSIDLDKKLNTGQYLGLGSAVDLDDATNSRIRIENGAGEVNPANDFTFIALFRTRELATTKGAHIPIASYSTNFGTNTPLFVFVSSGDNTVRARVESDTGATAAPIGAAITIDTWTWVAVVFDGIGGKARVYTAEIDGGSMAVGSDSGTLSGTTGVRQTTNDLLLGGVPSHNNLDGLISEVSLFDRALTEDEVAAIFGAPLDEDELDDADLLFHLPCNEGVLSWAHDLGPGENHGELQGTADWGTTLEGPPDLRGKFKPWAPGQSQSTPLVLVDRAMQIYQLNYEDSYVVYQLRSQGVGLTPELSESTPIEFTAADKTMRFTSSPLLGRFFVPDMEFSIASSTSNDGDYTVVDSGDNWVEVAEALVDEASGGNRVIKTKGYGTGSTTKQWSFWTQDDGNVDVEPGSASAQSGYVRLFGSHREPITVWSVGDREPSGTVPSGINTMLVKAMSLVGVTATSSLPGGLGIGARQCSAYAGPEGVTAREVIRKILSGAQSVGAFLKTNPSTGAVTFEESDLDVSGTDRVTLHRKNLISMEAMERVPPALETQIGYAEAHAHLSEGDLLGATTDEYRSFATEQWRWATYADPQVPYDWPESDRKDRLETALIRRVDAEAEAEASAPYLQKRVWHARAVVREDEIDNLQLGGVARLVGYDRLGFDGVTTDLAIIGYTLSLSTREADIWMVVP